MRKRAFLYSGLLLGLASLAGPAEAGTASLVANLDTGRPGPVQLVAIDGLSLPLGPVALVRLGSPASGAEIYATDGTGVGTRLLLDLCPGPCSTLFTPLGTVRQIGIFGARGENETRERLWRSDGTRPGTFPLTAGSGSALEACGAASANAGGTLFFSARLEGGACGLWRTDGSSAGTLKLGDVSPGNLTAAGSLVYFLSFPGGGSTVLWRTDGTAAGTIQLRTWPLGVPAFFLTSGNRFFFVAPDDGRELWTSDGTPSGTRALTRFTRADPFVRRSQSSTEIVIQDAGGLVCFLAHDDAAGREVWCSDGTPAGTRAATAIAQPSPFVGLPSWRVERLAGRLVFPALDGVRGNRWWTSDGRPASAAPLSGCAGGCPLVDASTSITRVGGRIFFGGQGDGVDLWITDGTGAGTRRIEDLCRDCFMGNVVPALGKLFFRVSAGLSTPQFWASDGTPLGTSFLFTLEDFQEIPLTTPVATVGGKVLLQRRFRFWTSDGTPEGTGEVTFLDRGESGSSPSLFTPIPDGIRFRAFKTNFPYFLWNSRGTPNTTTPVEKEVLPREMYALGALSLFHTGDSQELWRTDGTAAGTFRLHPEELVVRPDVVVLGNRALFLAFERLPQDDLMISLWETDGTLAGTRRITDLSAGSLELLPAGSLAVIRKTESSGTLSTTRLWRTDGTAAGTREIPISADFLLNGDIVALGSAFYATTFVHSRVKTEVWRITETGSQPLAADRISGTVGDLAVHGGALYGTVWIPGPGSDPGEKVVFRSDGTDAGTVILTTAPPPLEGFPDSAVFTSVGNLLFFLFEDEGGFELWRTDGTPAGTFRVRDLVPGRASSHPRYLTALGNRLYFTALAGGTGRELWESDGTEAGTRIVQDIAPGLLSSDPRYLVASSNRLFFAADDGVHGDEPWVYTPGGETCVATATALCLGGQFLVEADWRTPSGTSGRGQAVGVTADTGYFSFFDAANIEVILKVLDGRGLNDHRWVFYGALSDVEYALTVTDVQSGAVRRYVNPPGRLGSVADTTAFGPQGATVAGWISQGPAGAAGKAFVATRKDVATGSCAPSSARLCLNNGRFAVEARWKDFSGNTGVGQVHPLTDDTGAFWFFGASNLEVVLKVLDGRPLNGKFWVFYGALSTVEYTLTVTDTETGTVKTYTNPLGQLASVADTAAF